MIVPLTAEDTWLQHVSPIAEWTPPLVKTVVVAPHPDDETLAAGGLIAHLRGKGVPVSVIAVTDGENAYDNTRDLNLIREPEQTAALARLGVSEQNIVRLRRTDSGLHAEEAELIEDLRSAFRDAGHILAPWPHDYHPDHEACGRTSAVAAAEQKIPLTWYFFWTWHRGTPADLSGRTLQKLTLTVEEQEARQEALLCHASQLHRETNDPILPENLLAPARRPFEVFLAA